MMLTARLVGFVVAVCLVPPLLQWFGVDFGTTTYEFEWRPNSGEGLDGAAESQNGAALPERQTQAETALFVARGEIVHTLLEWTAVCVAAMSAVLSLVHYFLKRDVTTPVIATALMFAALLDGFRILAVDRLIVELTDPEAFASVSWGLSRVFLITLLISGLIPFLVRKRNKQIAATDLRDFSLLAVAYGLAAFVIIFYAGRWIAFDGEHDIAIELARRFNYLALLLFSIGGGVIVTLYCSKYPGIFATALVASLIPHSAAQLYATFGSDALFDAGFNLASFYKLLGYLVPVVGLIFDYRRASQADSELASTERQLDIARDIQQSLLPRTKPSGTRYDLAGFSVASEAVGGDYYDFITLPDGSLMLVVADVSGHDLGAALLMANARAYLKAWSEDESDVAAIMNSLNGFIARDAKNRRFITAMFVKAEDDGRLTFVCAGHTGYLVAADGTFRTLEQRNVPLGVFDAMNATAAEDQLHDEETLVLITDGIIELPNERGEPFGIERVAKVVSQHARNSADDTVAAIRAVASGWAAEKTPFDDITVAILKGPQPATMDEAASPVNSDQ